MDKLDSSLHLFLQGEGPEDTGIRMPDQQGTPPEGFRALTYLQAQFSELSLECEEPGSDSGLVGPQWEGWNLMVFFLPHLPLLLQRLPSKSAWCSGAVSLCLQCCGVL